VALALVVIRMLRVQALDQEVHLEQMVCEFVTEDKEQGDKEEVKE